MLTPTVAVSPIALLRFVRGQSQSDLAAQCRVSRETISRLERGELPRLDTARAVSAALGVDIPILFPENEEGAPLAGTPSHSPGDGDAGGNALAGR